MVEKKMMARLEIKLERLKIEREKAVLVLNKALLIYFFFLTVAILGFINGLIKVKYLNILVIMGFIVLFVGTVPYIKTSRKEEKELDRLEEDLK